MAVRQWMEDEWRWFEKMFEAIVDKKNTNWLVDLSIGQYEHPEWYESPCDCDLCRSYGD